MNEWKTGRRTVTLQMIMEKLLDICAISSIKQQASSMILKNNNSEQKKAVNDIINNDNKKLSLVHLVPWMVKSNHG